MSRVTWKFTWTTERDVKFYYDSLLFENYIFERSYRHRSVNMLNCNSFCKIYQGSVWSIVDSNEYCLDKKIGAFSKTRKPFFFRSKRKKNDT